MTIKEKIDELAIKMGPASAPDILQMTEDIYYYFLELEDFEVLKIEQTNEPDRMVVAACLTTMQDPFFKIVVTHTWQRDLAFDNEWAEFETTELGIVFRFLTWDDGYISGEIWFERVTRDLK